MFAPRSGGLLFVRDEDALAEPPPRVGAVWIHPENAPRTVRVHAMARLSHGLEVLPGPLLALTGSGLGKRLGKRHPGATPFERDGLPVPQHALLHRESSVHVWKERGGPWSPPRSDDDLPEDDLHERHHLKRPDPVATIAVHRPRESPRHR